MKKIALVLITTFYLGFANAQDSLITQELNEVLITATRTIRQLSSLPMPAQIISKRDIKNSNSVRLNDILNEQTGLITVSDFGGGEGIQLQGLDSQYTLILVDGVDHVSLLIDDKASREIFKKL